VSSSPREKPVGRCCARSITRRRCWRFATNRDTNPDTVITSDDQDYLQGLDGDNPGYSREIAAADRDLIMGHYRAYGGPEPPPIDHQGIDDAFLGKASVTWYFHNSKWLRLQGAD
jgi:hypothetical protein